MKTKKKYVIYLLICAVICVFFIIINKHISFKNAINVSKAQSDYSVFISLDKNQNTDSSKEIDISGVLLAPWSNEYISDSSVENMEMILIDVANDSNGYISVCDEYGLNEYNEYLNAKKQYKSYGFKSTFSFHKINIQDKVYSIYLRIFSEEEKIIDTGLYLNKGEIDFSFGETPDYQKITDDNLRNEILKGRLVSNQYKDGLWVVQKNEKLYLITNRAFYDKYKDCILQYQIWTTDKYLLPKERFDAGYDWDNRSSMLNNFSLLDMTEQYVVCEMNLPTEYPILSVLLGVFDEKWVWRTEFRPLMFERQQ